MINSKMHQTSHDRFHHFNALLRSIYLIVRGIASFLLELLVSNLVRIVLVLWLYKKYIILSGQMKLITAFVFVVFFVDGCDWTYTHDVINRFSKIDYTRMFNDLQSMIVSTHLLLNFIPKTILLIVILIYVHRLFMRIVQILTDHGTIQQISMLISIFYVFDYILGSLFLLKVILVTCVIKRFVIIQQLKIQFNEKFGHMLLQSIFFWHHR
jgi:hypothetical protein